MARDHGNPQRGPAGKLKAVARRWAEQRRGGRDELDDDLRAYGLDDQIKPHQPLGIWPENLPTVRVFLDMEHQWLHIQTPNGPMLSGLDHGQIKSTLELMRVKRKKWPEIFNGLKTMEAAVIETLYGEP